MNEIESVTVVGAGTMGSQIALQTALAGRYQVTLVDAVAGQLDRARAQNRKLVDRAVEKGRLTKERADAALDRRKSCSQGRPRHRGGHRGLRNQEGRFHGVRKRGRP